MSVQSMQALARANEVRIENAHIRRELAKVPMREGKAKLADLLLDPPPALLSARLMHLLQGIDRVGPQVARAILRDAQILPPCQVKPLRMLTMRQRMALASVLRGER